MSRLLMLGGMLATMGALSVINSVLVVPPGSKSKSGRGGRRIPTCMDEPWGIAPAVNKKGLYCHEQPIPRPYRGRDDKTWG